MKAMTLLVVLFSVLLRVGGALTTEPPPLSSLTNAAQILREAAASSRGKGETARLFVTGGYVLPMKQVDAFDLPAGVAVKVAPLPTPRYYHGAASVGGVLYVVGGDDGLRFLASMHVYIPQVNEWYATASMSTPRSFLGVCAFEEKVYAIGGYSGSAWLASAESYDPTTKTWTSIASMTMKRGGHAVGVLGGQVYAIGGYDGASDFSSVERYDPKTNKWSAVHAMETPRVYLSVGVVGEKLYAIGGVDERAVLKSVEVYDVTTNDWSHAADMPLRCYPTGAASFGGLVYVAGCTGKLAEAPILIFDPRSCSAWNTSTTLRLSTLRDTVGVALLL